MYFIFHITSELGNRNAECKKLFFFWNWKSCIITAKTFFGFCFAFSILTFSEMAKSLKPFKWEIAEYVAALMRLIVLFYNTQVYYFEHTSLFSILSTAARNRKYQHGRLCVAWNTGDILMSQNIQFAVAKVNLIWGTTFNLCFVTLFLPWQIIKLSLFIF